MSDIRDHSPTARIDHLAGLEHLLNGGFLIYFGEKGSNFDEDEKPLGRVR